MERLVIVAHSKEEHTYVYMFYGHQKEELLNVLANHVLDANLHFDLADAKRICDNLEKQGIFK
jgi:hypothetical protein